MHGRHIAIYTIGNFGVEKSSQGRLMHDKFHPSVLQGWGVGPKTKNFTQFRNMLQQTTWTKLAVCLVHSGIEVTSETVIQV